MMRLIFGLSLLLVFLIGLFRQPSESSAFGGAILIRKDRPSVYIEFVKRGKAAPLFPGEEEDRVWLKLNNNTRWTVEFCSLSVPVDLGQIGAVYNVWEIGPVPGSMRASGSLAPTNEGARATKIPQGYSTADTCTPYSVGGGRSAIFSVPRDHLAANLEIEIEFWYEWENKDNELGTYPQYFVSFENSRLPKTGQAPER